MYNIDGMMEWSGAWIKAEGKEGQTYRQIPFIRRNAELRALPSNITLLPTTLKSAPIPDRAVSHHSLTLTPQVAIRQQQLANLAPVALVLRVAQG
jgi:hypothetical protein